MKSKALCTAIVLAWTAVAGSPSDKSLLDLAPTLAELGPGWTTNKTVLLIDPRCNPPEQVPGQSDPKALLDSHRQMMKSSGRTAYLRIHYGFGDLIVNRGAYHVYLQRWESVERLSAQTFQVAERPKDRLAPNVGQEAHWESGGMFDRLVFRRDQYLVLVEFGPASDYSHATRLAQVIDAKLTCQPIPKPPMPGTSSI